jgi:uncharacterized protein YdaU (DUF1376 family)
MPMYWGDYLRDTQHLGLEEHGAYLLLIAHYWAHGELPTDHAKLKQILGLHGVNGSNRWRSICLAIAPFFDENWRHGRIDAELEKSNSIKEKRALAGFKGGSSSRGKNNVQRFTSQAIAKQTGGIPHKYITSSEYDAPREGSTEKKDSGDASPELLRSMQQKRWVNT